MSHGGAGSHILDFLTELICLELLVLRTGLVRDLSWAGRTSTQPLLSILHMVAWPTRGAVGLFTALCWGWSLDVLPGNRRMCLTNSHKDQNVPAGWELLKQLCLCHDGIPNERRGRRGPELLLRLAPVQALGQETQRRQRMKEERLRDLRACGSPRQKLLCPELWRSSARVCTALLSPGFVRWGPDCGWAHSVRKVWFTCPGLLCLPENTRAPKAPSGSSCREHIPRHCLSGHSEASWARIIFLVESRPASILRGICHLFSRV